MNDELAGLQKELLALLARAESELNAEDMECFRSVGASALDSMRRAVLVDAGAEAALPERYGIIGESEPMRRVFELLDRMIKSDYPALVTGESGTGKELVARAFHFHGPRCGKVFLSENCAAIPETLLESILFGHSKGAFTGAHKENPGHFVAADKGTLFLDEIGDMPLSMQSKLLRVIQDGEVRPVGGEKVRRVDVRLVAATNKNLEQCVADKTFRQDLFYRLNVLEIALPALRERGDDVLLIADYFLRKARRELGRPLQLDSAAERWLLAHPWPGNVRQLENEIRRAAALAKSETLGAGDFGV